MRPDDGGVRPLVMSYLTLRKCVGGIGGLLPFVLLVGNELIGYGTEPSMSAYYYTPMRNIWIGALCVLGVFLIAYDGWDLPDKVIHYQPCRSMHPRRGARRRRAPGATTIPGGSGTQCASGAAGHARAGPAMKCALRPLPGPRTSSPACSSRSSCPRAPVYVKPVRVA